MKIFKLTPREPMEKLYALWTLMVIVALSVLVWGLIADLVAAARAAFMEKPLPQIHRTAIGNTIEG